MQTNNLGKSVSYKIGGKEYTAQDMNRLQAQQKELRPVNNAVSAPNSIAKPLENQAGVVQTGREQTVHAQTETYRPSANTQARVQASSVVETKATATGQPQVRTQEVAFGGQTTTFVDGHIQSNGAYVPGETKAPVMTAPMAPTGPVVPEVATPAYKGLQQADQLHAMAKPSAVGLQNGVEGSLDSMDALHRNTVAPVKTSVVSAKGLPYEQQMADASPSLAVAEGAVAAAAVVAGAYVAKKVGEGVRDFVTETVGTPVKFVVKTEVVQALKKISGPPVGSRVASGGRAVVSKAGSSLQSKGDLGTQAAGEAITVAEKGMDTFRVAQKATTIGVEGTKVLAQGVKKVGNGFYQVSTTAGAATIAVGRTAKTVINAQVAPLSKTAIGILRLEANRSGFTGTALVTGIVNRVNSVKTKFSQIKTNVIAGAQTVKTAAKATVRVVRGVTTGTMTVNVSKATLAAFRNKVFTGAKKGVKTAVKGTARVTAKTVTVATFRGLPKANKLAGGGMKLAAGAMMASGDLGLQAAGTAVTAAQIGVKTTVVGTKAAGYTVKTAAGTSKAVVKGGKTIYRAVQYAKNNGIKVAVKKARQKATHMLAQAGKSVVTAIMSAAKGFAMKAAIPALLVCVIVAALTGMMSAPIAVVGSFFSGIFSTTDGGNSYEQAVREFLEAVIPEISAEYRQELVDRMVQEKADGQYHYVRFYSSTNSGANAVIQPDMAGVTSVFPADEELVNMLQSIFNAIVLMEYELEMPWDKAEDLVEELLKGKGGGDTGLFMLNGPRVNKEWCGQSVATGEGTAVRHSCGAIHALNDCLNPVTGTHSSFTCDECCMYYYVCQGHKGNLLCTKEVHTHSAACNSITCGKEPHTHTDGCKSRTCRWNYEHEHSEDCYTIDDDGRPRRICGKSVHFHSDSCYTITCGKNEHTHTESCKSRTCGKTAHTHAEWKSQSNPGCYNTSLHGGELTEDCGNSTKHFRCTGYKHCDGHTIASYTLKLEGVYVLEAKYFTSPIKELQDKGEANLNPVERKKLQDLLDYYEVFQVMMQEFSIEYSGSLGAGNFEGVVWVDGTRVPNQAVVDLALTQVGQQGGRPYWSYYGFTSRQPWCACFVHWCMEKTPSAADAWPDKDDTGNNAYCPTLANYFKNKGQWGDRTYTNLVAGDAIFFDWEGDGVTDHIGIVVGHDGSYVYTVEGNSGDAVKKKKYPIGSTVIYGYGLMNFTAN